MTFDWDQIRADLPYLFIGILASPAVFAVLWVIDAALYLAFGGGAAP